MENFSDDQSEILDKLEAKSIDFSVFGLGYVGLPLIVAAYENTPSVTGIGVDIDPKKTEKLSKGISYVDDISNEEVEYINSKGFEATVFGNVAIRKTSISLICVPTPVDDFGIPKIDYILSAGKTIAEGIKEKKKYHLIILESTTYPTTTEINLLKVFEDEGLELGKDFDLCFSPERIDPGNKTHKITDIPKILGTTSKQAQVLAKKFYEEIIGVQIIDASSPRVAEMTKLFENIFRQVNIALVNELSILAEKMDIDMYEVIELASTKPFGFLPHYPGPGLGGHCIPVDPYYLSYIAKKYKVKTRFIDLASEINDRMVEHTIELAKFTLNKVQKSPRNSKILFLGYTYKPNISDMRNSPAIPIAKTLQELGATIQVIDPHLTEEELDYELISIDEISEDIDMVIIVTPHDVFDWDKILAVISPNQPLLDTRGVIPIHKYREFDVALGRPNNLK